jgi:hypothetical protein
VLLFLAVMVAIDFAITGTSLSPVIQEYKLAAQARTGFYTVLDAIGFASELPLLAVVVLMTLYAVSQPRRESSGSLWRCLFIIAFFWVCQVVLNMSNLTLSHSLIYLAPAAAVAVVTWTGTSDAAAFWDRLWCGFHLRKPHKIPVREIIPLLILVLGIAPEALASLRAIKLDYSVASGAAQPIAVTANKGITFETLPENSYDTDFALSINRAIEAIEGLGANHDTIASLDVMDPFPALLLGPDPKGVSVFWAFGFNVPIGYKADWQEIIGDACIVTEPKHPAPDGNGDPQRLIDAMQSHLASTFTLVYQDEFWKIWERSGGCDVTGGSSLVPVGKQSGTP